MHFEIPRDAFIVLRCNILDPQGCPPRQSGYVRTMQDGSTPNVDPGLHATGRDKQGGMPGSISGWAIFLDVDGTLIDLAGTPDSIVVPASLQADLVAMSRKVDGALALVTGRPIDFVDSTFPGHEFCIAGLHGAEWRDASGEIVGFQAGDDFEHARERLKEAARHWPGVIVEDKGVAVAAHYRNASHLEGEVRAFMDGLIESLGPDWMLQKGKCVYELRPGGRDKGEAVRTFMQDPPFEGRRPLVIGDDITDEAMFHYANEAGGLSVRVGTPQVLSAAKLVIGSPSDVRRWISEVAA